MQQVCGMAVPQLSAVYLRNYWFWTGGFRVHKGGRVGIQLFCWHSRQIVQNLTLKKKVVVTWNTRANSKLMWSTTVQKICFAVCSLQLFHQAKHPLPVITDGMQAVCIQHPSKPPTYNPPAVDDFLTHRFGCGIAPCWVPSGVPLLGALNRNSCTPLWSNSRGTKQWGTRK